MRKQYVAPAVGYAPPLKYGYVIPVDDAVQYSVLELDASRSDAGTESFTTGSADSVLGRGVAVTVDGARGGAAHVVLLEHGIAGQKTPAVMTGVVRLVVGGEVDPGDRIVLGDFDDITGLRIRARAVEAAGTDGELAAVLVYFDGDQGFGQVPASDGGGGGGGGEIPIPPVGGRPPGGFDPADYLDSIEVEYPGTTVPPSLSFGGIAEF